MDKLKVAVIGVGFMGKSHVRVYSDMDTVELSAVCDSNKESARVLADKYNTNCYDNIQELISKEDIDAASICVPTKFHERISLPFIKSKINVLVEKPIAETTGQANKIIEEAKKNKVKLMVGHIERFNPAVLELKKRIQNGYLGEIYKVHCVRVSPFPQRVVDVGVTVDLAIHEIDILRYLINSRITRLYAETAQRIHSTHEDLLIGTIRFKNNILGVINVNWLTPKKVREITITGEKGMFVANYLTQELYFYENKFTRKNFDYNSNFMTIIEGKKVKIKIKHQEPLKNELKDFTESVIKNKKPSVSGEDGLDALDIAQKFLESSKNSEVINL